MKKTLCIFLIFTLVFAMASCGKSKSVPTSEDLTPSLTADAFLKALKARDMDALEKVYEGDVKDFSLEEEIEDPMLLALADKAIEKMLDFDYILDNEQIDGNNATVDVLFKTYDFEGILEDLTKDVISNIMNLGIWNSDPEDIEKKVFEVLAEEFTEALKTAKKDKDVSVTLKLVRKGGKWMVKDINRSDDLMYALSGGFSKLTEGLDNLFS